MNKKQKIAVLDYAIKSINRYDDAVEGEHVGNCHMCGLVGANCRICPFYHNKKGISCNHRDENLDWIGEDTRDIGKNIKQWQNELIKRTQAWTKRELPEYTVYKLED